MNCLQTTSTSEANRAIGRESTLVGILEHHSRPRFHPPYDPPLTHRIVTCVCDAGRPAARRPLALEPLVAMKSARALQNSIAVERLA